MRTLSWNCQGIGNDLIVRRLTEMCKKHRLGLVFLTEKKHRRLLLQNIQADFGFDNLFTVEPLGLSGGLALFYMDEFQVNVLFSNNRMIDIEAVIDGIKVFMTFVYGDPVLDRRELVCERLTRFSTTKNGHWFMIQDFNEITGPNEKEGGRQRSDISYLPFKQMLNDCGMLEFPFTGNMLSWVGKRAGRITVRCRLDRAVENANWHEKFPHSTVKYMRLWGSVHRPILVDILTIPMRRSKNFKFDKRWLDNEKLRQVILEGWKSSDCKSFLKDGNLLIFPLM